jgi:nucleoid-associated protein YgaU
LGNIEKYGVLALIFVIVLILAVAICHGPGDPSKSQDLNKQNSTEIAKNGEVDLRPHVKAQLEKQQAEEAKNKPVVLAPGADTNKNDAKNDKNPPVDKAPAFDKYVVKKNDTLESIAEEKLGSRTRWREIVKANEGLDPHKLKIDQTLLLPVVAPVAKADSGEKSSIKAANKPAKTSPSIAKSTR